MSSRRLSLHPSALSDAEYTLFTTSLADLAEVDSSDPKLDWERLSVSVREARAWLCGRYASVGSGRIDEILRLFPAPTLGGGAVFALLRLVLHTQAGSAIDRSLAFVQGHTWFESSASTFALHALSTRRTLTPEKLAQVSARRLRGFSSGSYYWAGGGSMSSFADLSAQQSHCSSDSLSTQAAAPSIKACLSYKISSAYAVPIGDGLPSVIWYLEPCIRLCRPFNIDININVTTAKTRHYFCYHVPALFYASVHFNCDFSVHVNFEFNTFNICLCANLPTLLVTLCLCKRRSAYIASRIEYSITSDRVYSIRAKATPGQSISFRALGYHLAKPSHNSPSHAL
ncbi:hypothetical protein K438DRAFT_1767006 [Mycena galopus ATCC 62051]|nr:hypothetical protein K438DRAFT_1767006 [Mycena galopus ATCC 62051]